MENRSTTTSTATTSSFSRKRKKFGKVKKKKEKRKKKKEKRKKRKEKRKKKKKKREERNEAIQRFKDMLKEHNVSAFSIWEKELPKFMNDPRYLGNKTCAKEKSETKQIK